MDKFQRRECKLIEVCIRPLPILVISAMKSELTISVQRNSHVRRLQGAEFSTDSTKNCSRELLTLGDVYTSGGKESAQLSRPLAVLLSLCENAVNSGLAWSFSRWSDSSACSARTQGAMKTGPAPDESPVSVCSDNSYIVGWQPHQIWSYGSLKSTVSHGFGSGGWICAGISPKPYKLWTWDWYHWIQQRLRFKRMYRTVVTTPSHPMDPWNQLCFKDLVWVGWFVVPYLSLTLQTMDMRLVLLDVAKLRFKRMGRNIVTT